MSLSFVLVPGSGSLRAVSCSMTSLAGHASSLVHSILQKEEPSKPVIGFHCGSTGTLMQVNAQMLLSSYKIPRTGNQVTLASPN